MAAKTPSFQRVRVVMPTLRIGREPAGLENEDDNSGVVLRALLVSDTHGNHASLGAVDDFPRADVLVHAGDFTDRGTVEEAQLFDGWLQELLSAGIVNHALVVLGNHDDRLNGEGRRKSWNQKSRSGRSRPSENGLFSLGHATVLDGKRDVVVKGVRFAGVGWPGEGALRDPMVAYGMTEDKVAERVGITSNVAQGCHILVSHLPPASTGALAGKRGCTGVRALLERIVEPRDLKDWAMAAQLFYANRVPAESRKSPDEVRELLDKYGGRRLMLALRQKYPTTLPGGDPVGERQREQPTSKLCTESVVSDALDSADGSEQVDLHCEPDEVGVHLIHVCGHVHEGGGLTARLGFDNRVLTVNAANSGFKSEHHPMVRAPILLEVVALA